MIDSKQAEEIKKKLLNQIENLPEENKEQIKKYIEELNETQLEEFLEKNKLKIEGTEIIQEENKTLNSCIFCSILNNQIHSYRLEETNNALAILEINPLSKGHTIIIPKEHSNIEVFPKSILNLAKKIAKRIQKKLKASEVKVETANFQGHAIINIIPIYLGEKLEKRKANKEELEELKNRLEIKRRGSRKNKKNTAPKPSDNIPIINFRIP